MWRRTLPISVQLERVEELGEAVLSFFSGLRLLDFTNSTCGEASSTLAVTNSPLRSKAATVGSRQRDSSARDVSNDATHAKPRTASLAATLYELAHFCKQQQL